MPDSTSVSFELQLFSAEAIQKAAYRLSNLFAVDFSLNEKFIICLLSPSKGISEDSFTKAIQEFKKEALDQQLRLNLKTETEAVRNLILGIAFSQTDLHSNG